MIKSQLQATLRRVGQRRTNRTKLSRVRKKAVLPIPDVALYTLNLHRTLLFQWVHEVGKTGNEEHWGVVDDGLTSRGFCREAFWQRIVSSRTTCAPSCQGRKQHERTLLSDATTLNHVTPHPLHAFYSCGFLRNNNPK